MSPSPPPSVDAIQSPTSPSPFLHNLQQRLRKGSNASRASSLSSDAAQGNSEPCLPQDAKATKRYLASIVKDDWEFPEPQAQKQVSHTLREASSYRLRDESASEPESNSAKPDRLRSDDPYKFDNPDDVGVAVRRRRARRHRLLEQELTENEGLRIWSVRRDAWVGAVAKKPDTPRNSISNHRQTKHASNSSSLASTEEGGSSTGRTQVPLSTKQDIVATGGTTTDDEPIPDSLHGPFLPIYPPLLSASHSLRSRIKPSAYPTIYSKVVIQGLAPNVPIPLNHMINALVNGWKAEGNWPPQAMEAQTAVSRRRSKKGESAFQRWKREQDARNKAASAGVQYIPIDEEDHAHKGVRKSITGAVKKAFGRKDADEDNVEQDLEKLGLTFEVDDNHYNGNVEGALANGHI